MIILDKKSHELLFYLLKLEEPETVMVISKKLEQSRRKIYYHLDKINEALPSHVEKILAYPRIGICLSSDQKVACQELVADLGPYHYVLHVKERLQLMLVYIAVSAERVTIEKLMALTDVSRNTVLNDLNLIRQELVEDPHGIKLEVNKPSGYYLNAQLLTKIRYLYRLLHTIYTQGTANFITILREKIAPTVTTEAYFSHQVLSYFQEQLHHVRENLGKTVNSQESELMLHTLPYLINSYQNMVLTPEDKSHIQKDFAPTKQRKEYHIAQDMAKGLQTELRIDLDEIAICLVAMLLLSYRKDHDNHLESRDYAQMRMDLQVFVSQLEMEHGLRFHHKDELLRQLLTHCKSLIYRKTYGILSNNPLAADIMSQYSDLFQLTKASTVWLQNAWQISLTDEDIAYITIHIGGALCKPQDQKQPQVILVCDEGIGVQKLLLNQCQNYLKQAKIEAVFTSEQFDSVKDILEADAIISTVDLCSSTIPILVVNPILSQEDIVRMVRLVGQQSQTIISDFGTELEACLRQHLTNDTDTYILKNKLEKLLYHELLTSLAITQD